MIRTSHFHRIRISLLTRFVCCRKRNVAEEENFIKTKNKQTTKKERIVILCFCWAHLCLQAGYDHRWNVEQVIVEGDFFGWVVPHWSHRHNVTISGVWETLTANKIICLLLVDFFISIICSFLDRFSGQRKMNLYVACCLVYAPCPEPAAPLGPVIYWWAV